MIGSGTIIVKEKGKLAVHIFSCMGWLMTKKKNRNFEHIAKDIRGWGKPNAEITESEADEILHSQQCISREYGPFYSKYAGDVVLMVDFDTSTLFTIHYRDKGADKRGVPGTEYWAPITLDE